MQQLHLRRVGVEPRADLVQGSSNDGGGSSSEQNGGKEDSKDPENRDSDGSPNKDADDSPSEDAEKSESPSNENQPPLMPASTNIKYLKDQVICTNSSVTNRSLPIPIISHIFPEKQHHTAATSFLHIAFEFVVCELLLGYFLTLYINRGNMLKLKQLV